MSALKSAAFTSQDGRKRAEIVRHAPNRVMVRCERKTCTRWAQEEYENCKTWKLAEAFVADYLGGGVGV
jgi:hypothetical protein